MCVNLFRVRVRVFDRMWTVFSGNVWANRNGLYSFQITKYPSSYSSLDLVSPNFLRSFCNVGISRRGSSPLDRSIVHGFLSRGWVSCCISSIICRVVYLNFATVSTPLPMSYSTYQSWLQKTHTVSCTCRTSVKWWLQNRLFHTQYTPPSSSGVLSILPLIYTTKV